MKRKDSYSLEEMATNLLESTFESLINQIPDANFDEQGIIDGHFNEVKNKLVDLKELSKERKSLLLNGKDTSFHDNKIQNLQYWIIDSLYFLKSDLLLVDSIYFKKLQSVFDLLRIHN